MTSNQRVHELKTLPHFFDAAKLGIKPFEIRENDRDFQIGDILVLCEFTPYEYQPIDHPDGCFTGQQLRREVTFVTDYAQRPGFVVMGIRE